MSAVWPENLCEEVEAGAHGIRRAAFPCRHDWNLGVLGLTVSDGDWPAQKSRTGNQSEFQNCSACDRSLDLRQSQASRIPPRFLVSGAEVRNRRRHGFGSFGLVTWRFSLLARQRTLFRFRSKLPDFPGQCEESTILNRSKQRKHRTLGTVRCFLCLLLFKFFRTTSAAADRRRIDDGSTRCAVVLDATGLSRGGSRSSLVSVQKCISPRIFRSFLQKQSAKMKPFPLRRVK